jgi:hypothetical protein
MILDPTARVAEALRLTRAGRLAEATALLQGVPQKQTSAEASEGFDRESTRTAGGRGRLIEMAPPRLGSTHWTAPGVDAEGHTSAARSEGSAQPNIAEAMRGFLARFGKHGSSGGERDMATGRTDHPCEAQPPLPRHSQGLLIWSSRRDPRGFEGCCRRSRRLFLMRAGRRLV